MSPLCSKIVYLRGLIEFSNRCRKDCLYCGIRCSNAKLKRYTLPESEVLSLASFALDSGYGSVVLQAGERCDSDYVEKITRLVYKIKRLKCNSFAGAPPLGVTLSLGEQSREVYREWHNAGADRYLLRIEASNPELYKKIHPSGSEHELAMHSYRRRLQALQDLKSLGYITGSGMMIGLPYQTKENLKEDLKFLQDINIDMVGMGPYIVHRDTPLGNLPPEEDSGEFKNYTAEQRLLLSIEMISNLRAAMPEINIAAATSLEVLDPMGKIEAVKAGANVIMPNITTAQMRKYYQLYEGKPGVGDDPVTTKKRLEAQLATIGAKIGWFNVGNPRKFL